MEDEIEEKLNEIYNLYIDVKFTDSRLYDVYVKINSEKAFCIPFLYDARSTFEANIANIRSKIDKEIVNLFRKEN